jgi:zinc ribbon protein
MPSPLFPVLDALSDGRIIRRAVTVALYVIGALILVAGAIGVIMTLGLTFRLGTTADVTIGGVLYSIVLGAACVAIFEVFRYRALKVAELGPSTFTVMPIMSIVFRLVGEVYAVALLGIGAGGFILNLFGASFLSGSSPFSNAPLLSGWTSATAAGFVGGVTLFALSALAAFAALLLFYFLAEATVIAADIARNVQLLAGGQQAALPGTPTSAAAATSVRASVSASSVGRPAAPRPASVLSLSEDSPALPTDANSRCPHCGAEVLETGSIFCGNCGAKLTPNGSVGV